MGLKFANVGLTFLTTVLLARLLGPSEYGVYAFVYATVALLSVPSEFGMPTLVIRETARGMLNQDFAGVQGIWRWAGRATAFISLGLVVLALAVIWFLRAPLMGQRLSTFLCALAVVPLVALGDLRGAALNGLHHIVTGQLPEFLVRPGIFILFLIVVALPGKVTFTAPLAMGLYVLAAALAFGIGAWLLWRATPRPVRQALPRSDAHIWWMSALPLAFIAGMQVIDQQSSILIQGFFLKDASIGVFRIASQVALLASFGLMTINTVLMPRFATLHAQGNAPKLQQLVTASARVILVFNLVLTAFFVLWGKPFLRIAFGLAYESAYVPLTILLVGQLINSAAGSVGMLLNMSGNERETARGTIVSVTLNVVLNLLLIPYWGINGSAVATSVSLVVWNIMLWRAVRRRMGINSLAFGG